MRAEPLEERRKSLAKLLSRKSSRYTTASKSATRSPEMVPPFSAMACWMNFEGTPCSARFRTKLRPFFAAGQLGRDNVHRKREPPACLRALKSVASYNLQSSPERGIRW